MSEHVHLKWIILVAILLPLMSACRLIGPSDVRVIAWGIGAEAGDSLVIAGVPTVRVCSWWASLPISDSLPNDWRGNVDVHFRIWGSGQFLQRDTTVAEVDLHLRRMGRDSVVVERSGYDQLVGLSGDGAYSGSWRCDATFPLPLDFDQVLAGRWLLTILDLEPAS